MTDRGPSGDDVHTVSYDLGDRAAPPADEEDASALGSAASSAAWPVSASASASTSASASSTGWRRGRPRHVPRHRRAFHRFYREHFGLVWSMVRRYGIPTAHHEDAVQEVWLVAYRRLHTLEPDASAKAWLSTITRRVASRLRRTEHRQHRKLAALHVASEGARVPVPTRVDEQDARRLLEALLGVLDEEQRTVLVLAQVHGLSGPEIAEALEIPVNTAYSRLRLARKRVDRFVEEAGAEQAMVLGALRRSEEPPPRAAARVWMVLVPQLGIAGAGVGTAAVGAEALAGIGAIKTFAIVAVIGVAGLVGARAVVDARAETRSEREVITVAQGAGRAPELAAPRTNDAPASASVGLGAASASASLQAATPELEAAAPTRSTSSAGAPSTPTASLRAASPTPDTAPESPARTDSTAPDASPSTLTAEAELLARAQQALRKGDPTAALRLLEDHERRFPSGELVDERRGARVRSLCALGRGAQARAEAHRLLRERPDSPVAAGVADVCS